MAPSPPYRSKPRLGPEGIFRDELHSIALLDREKKRSSLTPLLWMRGSPAQKNLQHLSFQVHIQDLTGRRRGAEKLYPPSLAARGQGLESVFYPRATDDALFLKEGAGLLAPPLEGLTYIGRFIIVS